MESEYQQEEQYGENEQYGPQPHPILHEPLLYISNLPPYVSDDNIAVAFVTCGPFRPKIPRDGTNNPLNGTIEFKFLEKGAPLRSFHLCI
jgi:polyadenylate-binding protein